MLENVESIFEENLSDPSVVKSGEFFYVFGSGDKNVPGFRTRTFSPGDAELFSLELDLSKAEGYVWGVSGFYVYHHDDGSYHGYGTLDYGGPRTIIWHFLPIEDTQESDDSIPRRWCLDRKIIGDLSQGWYPFGSKAVQDSDGMLYLIYNAGHPNEVLGVNVHIKALRLLDPATVDPAFTPRVLLGPSGFSSERRGDWSYYSVFGSFLERIQEKYILLYVAGNPVGKTCSLGVAYSDTLIPLPEKTYQRILYPDPNDIWNNPDSAKEVCYLMQSRFKEWPNYCGDFWECPAMGNIISMQDKRRMLIYHACVSGETRPSVEGHYVWALPIEVDISENNPLENWFRVILPGR